MHNVPDDYADMIAAFERHHVDFVIVGAYAVGFHGYPRTTDDIDFLVRPTPENGKSLDAALKDFGAPISISEDDMKPDRIIQIGVKPVRIDLITGVEGVSVDEIWATRVKGRFAGREVHFISFDCLLKNKHATGREKDKLDAASLERLKAARRKPQRKP